MMVLENQKQLYRCGSVGGGSCAREMKVIWTFGFGELIKDDNDATTASGSNQYMTDPRSIKAWQLK